MSLRKPPQHLNPSSILDTLDQATVQWSTYSCTLKTPMYGGGVKAGEVDSKMPIRASSIRGQLRFWWRLLAQHKYGIRDVLQLRDVEFAIWGGMGDASLASKVWLRVSSINGFVTERWAHYEDKKSIPIPEKWADAAYALFPAQGSSKIGSEIPPNELAKPEMTWQLALGLDKSLTESQLSSVLEALRWWGSFGGVGARTRRGVGAVQVAGLTPVSSDEVSVIGGCLALSATPKADATEAWKYGINKLREFRQKEGMGRNPGQSGHPGRSRWPEPDAIRRIVKKNHPNHAPVHEAGNVFPRAVFGLPIIFQFKDKKHGEPMDFSLQAEWQGKIKERMASPIIIRPYLQGEKWYAAALLLPHEHVRQMSLKLPDQKIAKPSEWWQPEKAKNIPPMKMQGEPNNALDAFLSYFKK